MTTDQAQKNEPETLPANPSSAKAYPAPTKNLVWQAFTSFFGPLTGRNIFSWVFIIFLVFFIRWALFEPYTIPSGSMEPTLHGNPRFLRGDRVGVDKWIYGLRVPFMNKRLFKGTEPKRWDIVVFKTVNKNSEHGTLVKRIVGLPGERIKIKDGHIWVNGEKQEPPEAFRDVLHYTTTLSQSPRDVALFTLAMAAKGWRDPELNPQNESVKKLYQELDMLRNQLNGRDPISVSPDKQERLFQSLDPVSRDILTKLYTIRMNAQYSLRYGISDEDEYSVVPQNCYLVCGDNSPESADGRWFGWLPNDHILGRVFCIWWPLSRWRDFTGFSHTWWGMLILYGVPTILLIAETAYIIPKLRRRK